MIKAFFLITILLTNSLLLVSSDLGEDSILIELNNESIVRHWLAPGESWEIPDLFIDCTFEAAGRLQLMDYAIAKHADGNWLSNFEGIGSGADLRWRSGQI
jgi:hypothetical protein